VAIALAMLHHGAGGTTQTQIARVLGCSGEINATYRHAMTVDSLSDPDVQILIVNSLWLNAGFSPNPAFINVLETIYNSKVELLPQSASEGAIAINQWIDQQTHHKISQLVTPDVLQGVLIVLINAIYFKGICRSVES
jgi:serpin B